MFIKIHFDMQINKWIVVVVIVLFVNNKNKKIRYSYGVICECVTVLAKENLKAR